MKIIFFGTSNVALPVLEVLVKQHQVLTVVSTPDSMSGRRQNLSESPVSALAKDLGINLLKPEKVKNNQDFLQTLKNLDAELFVVVSYGKILPLEIINLPKYKTINIHFAVLPKYRGPSPIQAALFNGDEQTGTTIFILNEKVDDGPLLSQEIVNIDSWDNFFTLSDRLAKKSAALINGVINDYITGKITPLPQNEAAASYTKIITKDDGRISWNKSSQQIYNQFRAFFIWPGIWTTWNGKKIKILDCTPIDSEQITSNPGTVFGSGIVACGQNTFLQIKTLQLEGKNETDIASFLNGYPTFVGSLLP